MNTRLSIWVKDIVNATFRIHTVLNFQNIDLENGEWHWRHAIVEFFGDSKENFRVF